MRKILLLCATASLAACQPGISGVNSTPVAPGSSISTAGGKVVLEGTRGLLLAHNAYQGAANGLAPLVRSGQLSAATVDRIESLNERAIVLLRGGDSAASLASRSASLFAIADELLRIGGK